MPWWISVTNVVERSSFQICKEGFVYNPVTLIDGLGREEVAVVAKTYIISLHVVLVKSSLISRFSEWRICLRLYRCTWLSEPPGKMWWYERCLHFDRGGPGWDRGDGGHGLWSSLWVVNVHCTMVGRCKAAWQRNPYVRSHVVMWHEVNVLNDVSFEEATKEVCVLANPNYFHDKFSYFFLQTERACLWDSN